jgi:hypothetical protein
MEKIFKAGVVGMGGIGHTHCNCIKNDPLAELIAVCDVNKAKADAAAEKFGVPAYYTLKEMLAAHPEIEVVHVTTSGFENGSWHYEPTIEALDAGRHVLVEKPISNNIEEARFMVDYAAKKGLYLGCDLNHYFAEPSFKADQIMADGKIAPDEYDLLYAGICADYGAADALAGYWRGGMTVQSPCYYVSYSVSAISVLQLYEIANTDGFDAAKDSYLKLFTYVDEDTEMTMEEILEYAGLLSFEDEELYKNLKDYMLK